MKKTLIFLLSLFICSFLIVGVKAEGNKQHNFDDEMFVMVNQYNNTDLLNKSQEYLNGLSLKELFEENNILSNGDFTENTTGWSGHSISGLGVSGGIASWTANAMNGRLQQSLTFTVGDTLLYYFRLKSDSSSVGVSSTTGAIHSGMSHSGSGEFETITQVSVTNGARYFSIIDKRAENWTKTEIDFAYCMNMTELGIDNLTQNNITVIYQFYQNALGVGGSYSPQTITLGSTIYYLSGNVIIDLTAMFGSGKEPLKAIFENNFMIYAPPYFEVYVNHMPLLDDDRFIKSIEVFELKDLDFSKSITGYSGDNIVINFTMYDASFYYDNPIISKPVIYYNFYGTFYNLEWVEVNEYNTRYFKANMTDLDNARIKRILFDRDNTTGYFSILDHSHEHYERTYYFEIQSKTLLKANIESVFIEADHIKLTGVDDAYMGMAITFYDKNMGYYGGRNILEVYDNEYIEKLYTFQARYTDVHAFKIQIINYLDKSVDNSTLFNIHEIGIFATNPIIIPPLDIIPDFSLVFPIYTCDIFAIGCHLRNTMTEISSTLYNTMGAESIANDLMGVVDAIMTPVFMFDDTAIQNLILVLYAVIPIGIIIAIVKRVT